MSDAGSAARAMDLLWRSPGSSAARRRSGSPLDLDRLVTEAMQLADDEGLPGLSMRRVAARLGVPVMTLYSHIPGRRELLDLMLDAVLGELYPDEQVLTAGSWRARVEAVVRANREFFLRHPWALHAGVGHPGPNRMRKYELELRALDGLGLSDVQLHQLVTLLDGFVRGTVGTTHSSTDGTESTGRHPWAVPEPYAGRVFDARRFPTAARVAPGVRADASIAGAADRSFGFALQRLLDGVGVLVLDPSR